MAIGRPRKQLVLSAEEHAQLSALAVGKWRQRFVERRVPGLHDELRSGRPRTYDDEQVARLTNTAFAASIKSQSVRRLRPPARCARRTPFGRNFSAM